MANRLSSLNEHLQRNVRESRPQILAFAIIMAINAPLYYLIWEVTASVLYDNLLLRAISFGLCIGLIIQLYKPFIRKQYFPFYWLFSICFCLPYFFTVMTLYNHGAVIWLMGYITALFFTFLILDFKNSLVVITVGISMGLATYYLTAVESFQLEPGPLDYPSIIATFLAVFIIGLVSSYNRDKIIKEKIKTVKALGASIAHELRTPLSSIEFAGGALQQYLPTLSHFYQEHGGQQLADDRIHVSQLKDIEELPVSIKQEVEAAFLFIDILLLNAEDIDLKNEKLEVFSVKQVITDALQRYPLKEHQRAMIDWQDSQDFNLNGEPTLFMHVIFNLLKNAVYFVEKSASGNISIWIENDEKYNTIHFKDTGTGIACSEIDYIFDKFYTKNKNHGTGIGLSFCKMVIEAHGGIIKCESVQGEFTHFIMRFAK